MVVKKETNKDSSVSDLKKMGAVAVAMTAFYGMLFAPSYFQNRAKAAAPQCWDIKEISGQFFKLNRCTGETVKLDLRDTAKSVAATKAN